MNVRNTFCALLLLVVALMMAAPSLYPPPSSHKLYADENGVVQNWFGNMHWKPASIESPSSLAELQALIKRVNQSNSQKSDPSQYTRLRAIGRLHSWSGCMEIDDGIMIRTEKLNRVLSVDKERRTIRAEAGIELTDLYKALKDNKLALETIPNVYQLSLGGIIANGAHGSVRDAGTMSSLVLEIEIIDYTGTIRKFTKDAPTQKERDYFEAAIVSIGHLGVIYSITLHCVPDYNVVINQFWIPHGPDQKLDHEQIFKVSEAITFVRGAAFTLGKSLHAVDPEASMLTAGWVEDVQIYFQDLFFEAFANSINKFNAARGGWSYIRSFFGKCIIMMFKSPTLINQLIKRNRIMSWDAGEILVRTWRDRSIMNVEYLIPRENLNELWDIYVAKRREYRESGKYDRKGPVVMRSVRADTHGFLSTTKGNSSNYVGFTFPYQATDPAERVFIKDMENEMIKLGGKVNWARNFNADTKDVLRNYPEAGKFAEILRELDPLGIFRNKLRFEMFGF